MAYRRTAHETRWTLLGHSSDWRHPGDRRMLHQYGPRCRCPQKHPPEIDSPVGLHAGQLSRCARERPRRLARGRRHAHPIRGGPFPVTPTAFVGPNDNGPPICPALMPNQLPPRDGSGFMQAHLLRLVSSGSRRGLVRACSRRLLILHRRSCGTAAWTSRLGLGLTPRCRKQFWPRSGIHTEHPTPSRRECALERVIPRPCRRRNV